jgi:hypothetical protein
MVVAEMVLTLLVMEMRLYIVISNLLSKIPHHWLQVFLLYGWLRAGKMAILQMI